MNNQTKRAGQSTRALAARRYKNRVWFVLGTIAIVTVLLLVANNSKSLGIGGIGLLGLFVAARLIMNYSDVKTNKMIKEERRAIRGAKGEETIGSILDGLGEEYLVIHDVVSTYGHIDHIVIGKQAGIFLLETKAHGGRVSVSNDRLLVNGHDPEKDFVAQALNNTYWLREKIRLDGWQATDAGKREVRRALRRTLAKYKLHKDEELFEKAYGYVREYY
jgi:hypothetical protein